MTRVLRKKDRRWRTCTSAYDYCSASCCDPSKLRNSSSLGLVDEPSFVPYCTVVALAGRVPKVHTVPQTLPSPLTSTLGHSSETGTAVKEAAAPTYSIGFCRSIETTLSTGTGHQEYLIVIVDLAVLYEKRIPGEKGGVGQKLRNDHVENRMRDAE